ncbi:hypothetical protein SLA2020_341500 [Shorea laevis]
MEKWQYAVVWSQSLFYSHHSPASTNPVPAASLLFFPVSLSVCYRTGKKTADVAGVVLRWTVLDDLFAAAAAPFGRLLYCAITSRTFPLFHLTLPTVGVTDRMGSKSFENLRHGRAWVMMVLGDIGRSPRMQYHALSLVHQKQWPKLLQNLPKILYPLTLLLKPIFQFVMLLWFLCIKVPRPDVFIVQV